MENYSGIFWTLLVVIIGIISVSGNKNSSQGTTTPPRQNREQNRSLPPPERGQRRISRSLPRVEVMTSKSISIYDYPKCPICRSRNLHGEEQTVFAVGNSFKCTRGHLFTGRD